MRKAPHAGSRPPVAGEFIRLDSVFRDWVSAEPGAEFPAEPGRYHLYVSYACPWAHRTMIVRVLKNLEDVVTLSIVEPVRDKRGWAFGPAGSDTADPLHGYSFLSEAYLATDPAYASRVTVPALWDRESGRIVNNESSEIILMLNSAFDEWGDRSLDLYPEELRAEIDDVNDVVYANVNNAVYRCGFARSQEAYDIAFAELFDTLDWLDARLEHSRFLVGSEPTIAAWRRFPTLVRFDPVYVCHFKCNKRRIADYPNLSGYLRDLYSVPGVAETVNMEHNKEHYFRSHTKLNPLGIIPRGPEIDLDAPHDRARLGT
jgi:putative glutathione S-transferase